MSTAKIIHNQSLLTQNLRSADNISMTQNAPLIWEPKCCNQS